MLGLADRRRVSDLTIADVEEIKRFLSVTRTDMLTWLPSPWEPGWKSEAASELSNAETGPGGVAWGEDAVRTAYAAAAIFLFAAADCLDAMADAANLLTTLYVPHVLARAVLEAGSQAWWLLEPGIGARRRVIRSILVRASSARYLGKAVRKLDPAGTAADFGEDQVTVRAYAASLGLTYVCNDSRVECEGERLPSYTARADDFERAVFITGAYSIYSGAAHAEMYSIVQGWRPSAATAQRWERRPERVPVWAVVLAAAGFATVPAFRAITLLGKGARRMDLAYSMRNIGQMARRMELPREWWY
jgi:hypothetical protein